MGRVTAGAAEQLVEDASLAYLAPEALTGGVEGGYAHDIFLRKGFSHCREKGIILVFLFTLFAMWLFAFIFAEVFLLDV